MSAKFVYSGLVPAFAKMPSKRHLSVSTVALASVAFLSAPLGCGGESLDDDNLRISLLLSERGAES